MKNENLICHDYNNLENLCNTAEVALRHTIKNLRFGVMLEDLKVLIIYNEYLKRNILKGPDIIQFIKKSEGKDPRIPIGTFQKILDLDKRHGSLLNKSFNSTKSQKIKKYIQ